jgi:nicotinate-nucleotide pyrophosphorylase (carboxylating)
VKGKVQVLLAAERLVLNIMQRMSGIATYTRMLVEKIKHTNAQLLDTRKTTPLFRFFEKEAVRIGGGMNHRMGLYDMIMIKDNHVDFSGGIRQAIDRVNHYLNQQHKPLKIEVEVRNFDELNEVLDGGNVHRIMLDNFSVENLKTAVEMIGGRFETEASGGINEQTITAYAETGVQYISVGALTHHVNSLDLSLKATLHDVEK